MTDINAAMAPVNDIQFSLDSIKWGLPLLIVGILVVIGLTRWSVWERFAQRKKWASRVFLLVLMAVLAFPMQLGQRWGMVYLPGQIRFENPTLTATAIKLGVYNIVWNQELETHLLDNEKALSKCVNAISYSEAQKYQSVCGEDRACFERIPPMTKADILIKIKESQKTFVDRASKECRYVDVTKL